MHFEAFISSQRQDLQQHLGFVQKLYIALDEPDGVAGVAASRKEEPTLHEQILDHKSSGIIFFLCKFEGEFSFIDFHKLLVNVSADDWYHYSISTFSILVIFCRFERQITRKKRY